MSEKDLFIKNSSIHKKGLFTKVGITKGKFISNIKGNVKRKVNGDINDVFANPDWVGFKKYWWIDPVPPFKFLNHSCEPNAGIRGKIRLYAMRDIKPNEELTIDYSSVEADPRWEMKCNCGSKKCRKKIRSIQFLPKGIIKKYCPFIPTGLKLLFYKENGKEN